MPKITDPASLVKRATQALATLRGCVVTPALIDALADVACEELPVLRRADVVEVLGIRRIRGVLLSDEVIEERARQLAFLAMSPGREAA